MNGLILSCGTRNKVIQYFKKELSASKGKLIGADSSKFAPALYDCDNYYLVPKFTENNYIEKILEICKKEKIDFLLSLIDTELILISENREVFEAVGVKVIGPDLQMAQKCLNKKDMYYLLNKVNVKTQKSYFSISEFKDAYNKSEISFPVFVKPILGSASLDINRVYNMEQLESIFLFSKVELMIQENMNGREYGVDCYIDLHTGVLIEIFIKEKIKMRAGETDKSVSVKNAEILSLIEDFFNKVSGFFGPVDIDIFEKDGEYYLSEINPRFGGGYPHAYECGINFPNHIINNLGDELTPQKKLEYPENIFMMKYNDIKIRKF